MSYLVNNFNGGEWGPRLRYRADLAKYRNSCAVLENFLPMPWGGVENRPGTLHIAVAATAGSVRLIAFQYNVETAYLIEAGEAYFRIYRDGVYIGRDVATPYLADELGALSFTQSNDVLFIAHANHPPAMLKRITETEFQYEVMKIRGGPYQDEDAREIELTSSAATGSVTVTADTADEIFKAGMEGTRIRWAVPVSSNAINETFKRDGTGKEKLRVRGSWKVTTGGSWVGTLHLERSEDGETFEEYRIYTVNADRNIEDSGYEENHVWYRFRFTDWQNPPSGVLYECRASLGIESFEAYGVLELTAITDARTATATVIEELPGLKSKTWSLSAWDRFHGYPALVQFYAGDRLVFARTRKEPTRLWLSATGDYLDFNADVLANSSLLYTVKTGNGQGGVTGNAIAFIANRKELVVGSWAEIGSLTPNDENQPLAPDNKKYRSETSPGSEDFPPIQVNDVLLFVRRGGENLLELAYNYMTDGYDAPDMTLMRPEILAAGGGIREMAYVQLPYPVVYCLRRDGVLASFTYNRAEEVTAWARQVTDGKIESVTVLQDRSGYDIIYLAVRRGDAVHIEQFARRDDSATGSGVFLDDAKVFDFDEPAEVLTGLEHLEGRSVTVVIDGTGFAGLKVEGGRVELPRAGSHITVGIPYTSTVETLPLDLAQGPDSTFDRRKRNPRTYLKYYRSLGGEIYNSGVNGSTLIFRIMSDVANGPIKLKTGSNELALPDRYGVEKTVTVIQHDPFPITVLALVNTLEVS